LTRTRFTTASQAAILKASAKSAIERKLEGPVT